MNAFAERIAKLMVRPPITCPTICWQTSMDFAHVHAVQTKYESSQDAIREAQQEVQNVKVGLVISR